MQEQRALVRCRARLGGGPRAQESPHDHHLPNVICGVVDRQKQLSEVRLICSMRSDGREIDPSVSCQFLELVAILAYGRDAPLPRLWFRRFG